MKGYMTKEKCKMQELVKAALENLRQDRQQVKCNTKIKPTGQAVFFRALRKTKRQVLNEILIHDVMQEQKQKQEQQRT